MRVLQVLDSRGFGGIETHVGYLAGECIAQGYECHIVLLKGHTENHPLQKFASDAGVGLTTLDGRLTSLIRLIKEKRPHLLHSHGYKANLLCRLLKCVTGVQHVATYHNGDKGVGRTRMYTAFDKLTCWLSQNIAVSLPIQKFLRPFYSHHIPNFLPLIPVAQTHESSKTRNRLQHFAFVGRVTDIKNPQLFVDLARLLPDKTFHICGDGPLLETITRNKAANLVVHGNVKNMSEKWRSFDSLLITSHAEGLPLVALEAMARGKVVVSTSVGDMPQLIQQGQNGFLCKKNLTTFAKLIRQLDQLSRKKLTRIQSNAVRTIHSKYSANAIAPRIFNLYQTAVKPGFEEKLYE